MKVTTNLIDALKAHERTTSSAYYAARHAFRDELYAQIAWEVFKINTKTRDPEAAKLSPQQDLVVKAVLDRAHNLMQDVSEAQAENARAVALLATAQEEKDAGSTAA